MHRKIKTHINYKKDGVEIRPASLHEECEIGNWPSTYPWIKLGYEDESISHRYSDIMYVMRLNNDVMAYFNACNEINIGENKFLPLYSKELKISDLAVSLKAYARYGKILFDYLIEYSIYNGYKAISFKNVEGYDVFKKFVLKNYKPIFNEGKYYIINENPRIRSCQKFLTTYKEDKISLEDLYFLYALNFDILKTKCKLKLNNGESIEVDRLSGAISLPANVTILKDELKLNENTRYLIEIITEKYDHNDISEIKLFYDNDNPYFYEALIDGLLNICKSISEMKKDIEYVTELKRKGYNEVLCIYFTYDMNDNSFLYSHAIYKLV